jgi:hypothetical protein
LVEGLGDPGLDEESLVVDVLVCPERWLFRSVSLKLGLETRPVAFGSISGEFLWWFIGF